MIRTFRDYSALLVAFSLIVVAQKVDWGCRLASPPGPVPQPTIIVLPPPIQSDGLIRKAAEPHTNDLGSWALFLDGRVAGPYIFMVTAYNENDGHTPRNITASGLPVVEGITAACGPEWPLGTVIVLENGMVLKCLDRGGWITGGRLDVYFDSLTEAQEFGIQEIRGVVIR